MHREHVDSCELRDMTHCYPENTSLELAQHAPRHCIREERRIIRLSTATAASFLVNLHLGQHRPPAQTALHFCLLSRSLARMGGLLVPAERRRAHSHSGHCLCSWPAGLSHTATRLLEFCQKSTSMLKLVPGLARTSPPQTCTGPESRPDLQHATGMRRAVGLCLQGGCLHTASPPLEE